MDKFESDHEVLLALTRLDPGSRERCPGFEDLANCYTSKEP